jgi:hypothetical protein
MTDPRQTTIAALAAATDRTIARSRPIYSEDFRAWYAAYPRKRSPGDAWKAWQAIAERPPLAEMLAALDWQKRLDQWTRDAGRWIPYPATYLRGRAWEDDPPAAGPWCAWHRTRRNDGHRAPSGPREGCPECRHLEAARGTRSGEPTPIGEVLPAWTSGERRRIDSGLPPTSDAALPDHRDSPELRADFARLYPGSPWPGYAAAFRLVSEKL